MSLKNYWQRICQTKGKSEKMNDENQEFLNEDPENIQEESQVNEQQEISSEDEIKELKDRNLRLFAEFENFRKRTTKERLEMSKYANENLLQDMLPVLDDFERARKQIESSSDENLIKGIDLIQHKLINTLSTKGLKAMEVNPGDEFDVEKHEAITQLPAPSEDLSGKIIDIIETGYTLNDKVIRFAKVVVGK